MAKILLIVTSGIAAYKCPDLVRKLVKAGHDVRCVLTKDAHHFVAPLALSAVSNQKVYQDLFDLTDELEIGHIQLAREADVILVAPATANFMAKAVHGLADDLASTVMLAADGLIMMAPAMNPYMYGHPATQENIATLKRRGVQIIGPDQGDMACGEFGAGRMVEPEEITQAVNEQVGQLRQTSVTTRSLQGKTALVTSGPTHEAIDPVRFVGNRSSGKQGHAIAAALAAAGADVTLVTGPVSLDDPLDVRVVHVQSASQMLEACMAEVPCDVAVCAAAVADWRPADAATQKMKKQKGQDRMSVEFVQNPDILATIAGQAQGRRPELVVGFAAETENVAEHAIAKRTRKKCDWILANDVSGDQVFGEDRNSVILIREDHTPDYWPTMAKSEVARQLVASIVDHLGQAHDT